MSNIIPFEHVTTENIVRFEVESINVQLFSTAIIYVNLFNRNGYRVKVERITLSGDDYTNWGNDDQYILMFVATSLGFTVVVDAVVVDAVVVDAVVVDAVVVDAVVDATVVDATVVDATVVDATVVDATVVDAVM